jgi:hypothetical protein
VPFQSRSVFPHDFRWTNPHTWPWVVWVWAGFLVFGWIAPLWKWFRRDRVNRGPPPAAAGLAESPLRGLRRLFFVDVNDCGFVVYQMVELRRRAVREITTRFMYLSPQPMMFSKRRDLCLSEISFAIRESRI